jgi:S1-C subfamily serine protease
VATNAARTAPGLTAHQIYERAGAGVVTVNSSGVTAPQSSSEYLNGESAGQGTASGSGFEVGRAGTILTNWHVVEGASKITVVLGEGAKTIEGTVVGKDPSHDLALLRIPTAGIVLHPLTLGSSAAVQVGEPALAIGDPFGYSHTLTTGIISALQRQITAPNGVKMADALQTDTPINPGSSGGPLLNAQGQVIGINSQIVTATSGGGNVGIAFAIPIDIAKSELGALESGK